MHLKRFRILKRKRNNSNTFQHVGYALKKHWHPKGCFFDGDFMKKTINTKYLDIHVFGSFGLGILYTPGWNLYITLLFVSFNIHYPIRMKLMGLKKSVVR